MSDSAGSGKAPRLILPPGARTGPAEAVRQAIDATTYPRLQRIEGLPHLFPAGNGVLLRLYIQTSPLAGRVLQLGTPYGAPITDLSQLLRDTANALDGIAHGPDTAPHLTQTPRPPEEAPTGSTGNPSA